MKGNYERKVANWGHMYARCGRGPDESRELKRQAVRKPRRLAAEEIRKELDTNAQ